MQADNPVLYPISAYSTATNLTKNAIEECMWLRLQIII